MRCWMPIVATLMLSCLVSPGVLAQGATPPATPADESPIVTIPTGIDVDLAAMVLSATEIDPAFASRSGALLDAGAVASLFAGKPGVTPDDLRDQLDAAGFLAAYQAYSGVASDTDPSVEARSGRSYVWLFADSAGAEAGFALLGNDSNDPDIDDVPAAMVLGDQSELTRFDGIDPASGARFSSLDYTFRTGNLLAGVELLDYEGAEPEEASIYALAEQQLTRVREVLDAGSPGQFQTALRLDSSPSWSLIGHFEDYALLNGLMAPLGGETAVAYTARAKAWTEAGMTSVYRVDSYLVPTVTDDPDAVINVVLRVSRFTSDQDAAAYAEEAATTFIDGAPAGYMAATELETIAVATGAASGLSYDFQMPGDPMASGYAFWVQHGSDVIEVQSDLPGGIAEAGVAELVAAQAACLDGPGELCMPVPLPENLVEASAGPG